MELLLTGMDINGNGRKKALLLHYAGKSMRVNDIYNAENPDTPVTYAATEQILCNYFSPCINAQIALYKFRNSKHSNT